MEKVEKRGVKVGGVKFRRAGKGKKEAFLAVYTQWCFSLTALLNLSYSTTITASPQPYC